MHNVCRLVWRGKDRTSSVTRETFLFCVCHNHRQRLSFLFLFLFCAFFTLGQRFAVSLSFDVSSKFDVDETSDVLRRKFISSPIDRTKLFMETNFHASNVENKKKRFRPSIRCQHFQREISQLCSAEGFMECFHCNQICCFRHIVEHQNQLRTFKDKLVQVSNRSAIKQNAKLRFLFQESNEVYLTIVEMKIDDNRQQIRNDLNLWKQTMFEQIETNFRQVLGKNETILFSDFSRLKLCRKAILQQNLKRIGILLDLPTAFNQKYHKMRNRPSQISALLLKTKSTLIDVSLSSRQTH